MNKLNASEFLSLTAQHPVIDVRSPVEFNKGHIPGAINIPLFTDRERAVVGTLYKREGREKALSAALDMVGPKMSGFVTTCRDLSRENFRLIHCWRGGMRSESFAWLMSTAGMTCAILEGGYKAYRSHLRTQLNQPLQLILVTGSTGSGKTEILQQLARMGEQVIDLEALARHRGSVFGGLALASQPTTEQFQNNLMEAVSTLDPTQRIWLEDESIGIGEVHIPAEFWSQMTASPLIKVALDKKARIQRLVDEYGLSPIHDIKQSIEKINRRLGGLHTQLAISHLEEGDLARTADILLQYYDKAYGNSLERKMRKVRGQLSYERFNAEIMATDLIQMANKIKKPETIDG